MSRLRSRREFQALDYMRHHPWCSALDIGAAAVEGEYRARNMGRAAKEALGLAIVSRLIKRGWAAASMGNHFTLTP
jgi:hypothetical protein